MHLEIKDCIFTPLHIAGEIPVKVNKNYEKCCWNIDNFTYVMKRKHINITYVMKPMIGIHPVST